MSILKHIFSLYLTISVAVNNESATRNDDLSNTSIEYDHVNPNSIFLPAVSSAKASSGRRRGKFFGVTTGATGNNLQVVFFNYFVMCHLLF